MKQNCMTCKYVHAAEESAAVQGARKVSGETRGGFCRRYPPTAVMMPITVDKNGQAVRSAMQQPAGQALVPSSIFPPVNDTLYCAEYQPPAAKLDS